MSVVYFLLLVGILVAVHELGHFAAAKLLDIKVLRFSLGFGPALVRVHAGETVYQVGWLPLGGYVRLLGENPGETVAATEQTRSFAEKALWKRAIVVLAGPAANLLLALGIYFVFYAAPTELPAAVVGDVLADSPAAKAQLQAGDRIVAISGQPMRYFEDVERIVDKSPDTTLQLKVRRGREELITYVTPERRVFRQRDGGAVERGFLGITQAPALPVVGVLDPRSSAARAGLRTGDVVISVDGEAIDTWAQLDRALHRRPGRTPLAYLRPRVAQLGFADVRIYEPVLADLAPDTLLDEEGRRVVETGVTSAEFFLTHVEPGSPAAAVGLRAGDRIVALDGTPVRHWILFDQALQAAPEREFALTWRHAEADGHVVERTGSLRQVRREVVDEYGHLHEETFFGADHEVPLGAAATVPIDGRLGYAASHALERTGMTIVEMTRGFASLLAGRAPGDSVGGPLTVYRIASVSAEKGFDAFLLMLALISVNLGLINLLPVPLLDGGHLVLFGLEALRRRRLSPRLREAAATVGLVFIVSLTALALRNDIVRYLLR